jgi:hypothetical protein
MPSVHGDDEKREARRARHRFIDGLSLGVTPREFLVGYRLMTRMPDDLYGTCFPAVATLAAELHCTPRAVQKALRGLVRKGWFDRLAPLPERRTNRYRPRWMRAEHQLELHEVEKSQRKRDQDTAQTDAAVGEESFTLKRTIIRPVANGKIATTKESSPNHLLKSSFSARTDLSLSEDTSSDHKRAAASAPASKEASSRREMHLSQEDQLWKARLAHARQRRIWYEEWGPTPNQAGCSVPNHLVRDIDGKGWELANLDPTRSWEGNEEIRPN